MAAARILPLFLLGLLLVFLAAGAALTAVSRWNGHNAATFLALVLAALALLGLSVLPLRRVARLARQEAA